MCEAQYNVCKCNNRKSKHECFNLNSYSYKKEIICVFINVYFVCIIRLLFMTLGIP